jgi:exodeoxyribonuclease V alpha subunit
MLPSLQNQINLSGVIERVTFKSAESGYGILKMKVDEGIFVPGIRNDRRMTLVGSLADIGEGQRVSISGEQEFNPKFGPQVKVAHFTLLEPQTVSEVLRYLVKNVKFVKEVRAQKIIAKFGMDTLRILDEEPDRLYEVDGLGKTCVEGIKAEWKEKRALRDLLVFAGQVGIGPAFVAKIFNKYGADAVSMIREDPYRLARDIHGVGFKSADEVAQGMGVEQTSIIRIIGALRHLMDEHQDGDGDCFVYRGDLVSEAIRFLEHKQIDHALVNAATDQAIAQGIITDDEGKLYSPEMYEVECRAARRLRTIIDTPMPSKLSGDNMAKLIEAAIESADVALDDTQKQAVTLIMKSKLAVLTGGPGTGKTTITKAIVNGYVSAGVEVHLMAPTGSASKRMTKVVGYQAVTVHRKLHAITKMVREGLAEIEEVMLDGVVIVDEASMVDVKMLNWLLSLIKPSAVVVFVGDQDQLPSIGPGAVLRDLLRMNDVGSIRLTEIHRQAANSDIIKHAHTINLGHVPEMQRFSREIVLARGWPNTDFLFIEKNEQHEQNAVARWCASFLATKLGFSPKEDVQVLSPMKKGDAGVEALNRDIQAVINPNPSDSITRFNGERWGTGDRIMYRRNNYDIGLYNGDQGIIREFIKDKDGDATAFVASFDGLDVRVEKQDWIDVGLSYAMSIHKSQGSESPMIIICLHTGHFKLLQRNLLFTGVTRTRRLVVLIGHAGAISMAVRNNKVSKRNTRLAERVNVTADNGQA